MRKQGKFQYVLGALAVAGFLTAGGLAFADDTAQLKEQVQALQQKVDQLESQLGNYQEVDPFAQMMLMRQQNIPYFLPGSPHLFADVGAFNPEMDMKKSGDKYIITMDIPGMDKDKINVEIKEGSLIISGERQSESKDSKNNQYYRQERSFGSFMQVIPLPEDAKQDQVDAKYKNGVLTVTVNRVKKEDRRADSQRITVR